MYVSGNFEKALLPLVIVTKLIGKLFWIYPTLRKIEWRKYDLTIVLVSCQLLVLVSGGFHSRGKQISLTQVIYLPGLCFFGPQRSHVVTTRFAVRALLLSLLARAKICQQLVYTTSFHVVLIMHQSLQFFSLSTAGTRGAKIQIDFFCAITPVCDGHFKSKSFKY